MFDLVVIGGGAAGFYAAIHTARFLPGAKILILEQNKDFLSKVRISGGGRCNVTHRPLEPEVLASHYPRGERELRGPFTRYASRETMTFFEELGVTLKIEQDGRVFPTSNQSQTIIDALMGEVKRLGIKVQAGTRVTDFCTLSDSAIGWKITANQQEFKSKCVLVCPGSSNTIWKILGKIGHEIVPPVPSLFTFRIADPRLADLPGIITNATVSVIPDSQEKHSQKVKPKGKNRNSVNLTATGPLLITHWGLSGPAVLKLSAWGARYFAACEYRFKIRVNWLPDYTLDQIRPILQQVRSIESKKAVWASRAIDLPVRLWKHLVQAVEINPESRWSDLTGYQMESLGRELTQCEFSVSGKSTFKDEFVTAGGVSLKEIQFKTFESKIVTGLFLAGEVLDIDAITGGFNFQNAWTGGYIAACGVVERLQNQERPR